MLSGFGMTICGGSYPASQGEHLLSHYVDDDAAARAAAALHGEQIGVCALAMARLQDAILARDAPPVRPADRDRRATTCVRHFGAERGEACWRELEPKRLDRRTRRRSSTRGSRRGWDAIRDRIARRHARRRRG